MATGKNVFVIFTDLADEIMKSSEAEPFAKLRRKGAIVPLAAAKDVRLEALAGAGEGESIVDAAKAAGHAVGPVAAGSELSVTDNVHGETELCAVLDQVFAVASPKMLVVVVAPAMALFYGLGIERNVMLEKPLPAACIAPTLAWLGDLPLPSGVQAAPAYGVIKGLNYKAKEIAKLRDGYEALMLKIERDNRKPWDKHDCA